MATIWTVEEITAWIWHDVMESPGITNAALRKQSALLRIPRNQYVAVYWQMITDNTISVNSSGELYPVFPKRVPALDIAHDSNPHA